MPFQRSSFSTSPCSFSTSYPSKCLEALTHSTSTKTQPSVSQKWPHQRTGSSLFTSTAVCHSSPHWSHTNHWLSSVSPYSWFGFTNTLRYRPNLEAHGVEVNIVPFFLGAARNGAGNPWQPTPKWKEAFAKQDTEMTGRLLGLKIVPPKVFPISSLYVSYFQVLQVFEEKDEKGGVEWNTDC